jgi:hypothetical protein
VLIIPSSWGSQLDGYSARISDASRKETVHKRRCRPIIGFHPGENPHSQNNAFNKAIARHNQLSQTLDFHPAR